jgi:hypothetical protein
VPALQACVAAATKRANTTCSNAEVLAFACASTRNRACQFSDSSRPRGNQLHQQRYARLGGTERRGCGRRVSVRRSDDRAGGASRRAFHSHTSRLRAVECGLQLIVHLAVAGAGDDETFHAAGHQRIDDRTIGAGVARDDLDAWAIRSSLTDRRNGEPSMPRLLLRAGGKDRGMRLTRTH